MTLSARIRKIAEREPNELKHAFCCHDGDEVIRDWVDQRDYERMRELAKLAAKLLPAISIALEDTGDGYYNNVLKEAEALIEKIMGEE